MNQKLLNIVKNYKKLRINNPDNHLQHCQNQNTLDNAIYFAARALDGQGKKHAHQRRLKIKHLTRYANNLSERRRDIEKVKTFDELHEIGRECAFKGIGKLTIYDTTHRIGKYLDKKPEKVYLHAGTKAGAKKLLKNIKGKHFLTIENMPPEFQIGNLNAEEIEDILCIYKKMF